VITEFTKKRGLLGGDTGKNNDGGRGVKLTRWISKWNYSEAEVSSGGVNRDIIKKEGKLLGEMNKTMRRNNVNNISGGGCISTKKRRPAWGKIQINRGRLGRETGSMKEKSGRKFREDSDQM